MNKHFIVLALIALLCISQVEGWRLGRRNYSPDEILQPNTNTNFNNNENAESIINNNENAENGESIIYNGGNTQGTTTNNNNNGNNNQGTTTNNNYNNGNNNQGPTNNNYNNGNNNQGTTTNNNNNGNNNQGPTNNNHHHGNTQGTTTNNNNNGNNQGSTSTGSSVGSGSSVESEFLALHNNLRAKFGIPPLTWSSTLASYSQSWSDTMASTGAFHHGNTHGTGENIAYGTTRAYNAAALFGFWKNEDKIFITGPNYPHVSTTGNALDVSHYTQILWSRTTEVGCGLSETASGLSYLTCQYSPPGNILGQPVY